MHNLGDLLDNIKGNMQQAKLHQFSFMAYGRKGYFISGFLIRWSGSTLHRSIYLSRQLELSMGAIT